jgi:DNA-binding MarR family transcriptional regulator
MEALMSDGDVIELTPKGWQVLAEVDRRELRLGRKMTDEEAAAFLEGWEKVTAILDGHYE